MSVIVFVVLCRLQARRWRWAQALSMLHSPSTWSDAASAWGPPAPL